MVRHHHDSSQLTAALFGSYQEEDVSEGQQNSSQTNKIKDFGAAARDEDAFWNRAENGSQRPAQPTDKPPDFTTHGNLPHVHPYNDIYPHRPPQAMLAGTNPINMQHNPPIPINQQQTPPSAFSAAMSASSMNSAVMLPTGSSPGQYSQYYPMPFPMSMSGYGGAPIYVIMAPQAGVSPILSEINQNHPQRNSPNFGEGPTKSAASDASHASQKQNSPRPKGSLQNELAGIRSKWGEKGVGVGHLWSPEETPKVETRPPSTPFWVNNNESDNVLPGLTNSMQGEKTHARGSSVVLDSQQMAERNRKLKQAQENQRIIQLQLEDKRRRQIEAEERDRIETEQMERRINEQQEKERKQFEEEQNKKREKEEAEMKRQEKLREAIAEASERAKKEKDRARMEKLSRSTPAKAESNVKPTSSSSRVSNSALNSPTKSVKLDLKNETTIDSAKGESEETKPEEGNGEEESNQGESIDKEREKVILPDLVQTSQLSSLGQAQKMALLRALGVAPDYLLSSGVFERSSFRSMLNQSLLPTPLLKEEGGDYIRNRVLTPTKFRTARDCGTQYSESDRLVSSRMSRRRESRRQKKTVSNRREAGGSSPESRPPWGKNQSDRPYRKQSEKDPYSGRKIKKKPSRSVSVSDRESHTEDSDAQQGQNSQRRRRKTWDMSRAESLSSDFSRSPSPRRKRGPAINLPRGPPPIKPALMPSISKPKSRGPESSLAHSVMTSNQIPPSTNQQENTKEAETRDPQEPKDDADFLQTPKTPFRSTSPPVPALMKKISGISSFDVPAYPPGVEPLHDFVAPNSASCKATSSDSKLGSAISRGERARSPPVPAIVNRQRTNSLPSIQGASPENEEEGLPSATKREGSSLRRASLTSGPRRDSDRVPSNVSRVPSSKPTQGFSPPPSKPSTPRRLPPMSCPPSPSNSPSLNSISGGSPLPKPSSGRARSLERITTSKLADEESKITPVEISPRLNLASSLMSTTAVRLVQTSVPASTVKKKDSSDSGILSGEGSRPGSPESQEEDFKAMSILSSGYDSCRQLSVNDSQIFSDPLVSPEKWQILKSLSSLRQNLWKRHQEMNIAHESEAFS